MENIILSGMLRDFVNRHGLSEDSQDRQFEKFVNYCLLKTDHYDTFDFEKVGTGDSTGVDGIAVSIGGVIIDEISDLEALTRAQFNAKFVFSQAKTSTRFDLGEYLKFIATVKVFFGKERDAVPAELQKAFDLKTHIYNQASAKLSKPPVVELAFVYTGRFDSTNETVMSPIRSQVDDLKAIPYLFSEIHSNIYDGEAIAKLYRETQNEILVEIPFERHVALPKIRGAKSAYLGVVRCSDYVKIIQKENGEINKGLFFENVRDFLGSQNPVNDDIAQTIHRTNERDRFAILNNGVTIVARGVTPSGDTFRLSQFQVVNGCQTSHVLFNNREHLTDDMYLTVKLVETSDIDLSGQVISTTNSQSQVTKEAFATIRPYHRLVEDFFNAMRDFGYGYYYERRPHQYDEWHDIQQQFITTAPALIKSFISAILEEPHKVHYYYGTLLSEYNQNKASELFTEGDYPGLYFAAHHITFRARGAASKDKRLKEWGFHLALLVKRILAPQLKRGMAIPDKKFLDLLARIDENFEDAFKVAADFLIGYHLNTKENRSSAITTQLLDDFSKQIARNPVSTTKKTIGATDLQLKNGRYVGTLEHVDVAKRRARVQYGPFRIDGEIVDDEVLYLEVGARVVFTADTGKVTIAAPTFDK
ncbi:AIPR family protein [Chromobacterium violaceum]|uniref:AIPR family protein n=1 Tax=Chromobacterium violaceum TaxID=536 RepID=UPI003DA7DF9F